MKGALAFAVVATLLVAASASCPNQCSGHGTCGTNDKCTCFTQKGTVWDERDGWTGADCSLRTCPLATAWDRISTQSQIVYPYKYTSAASNSTNFLDAGINDDTAQLAVFTTETFNEARDRNFMVRVAKKDTDSREFTFEWKYDTDTYWNAEMDMAINRTFAQDLGGSGVRIYWNDPDNADVTVGDLYEFSANHNEGVDFHSYNVNTAHQQQECAGRGQCDRKTGECICDVGYGGEACARTTCPSITEDDCSGHGICQSLKRFGEDAEVACNANTACNTRADDYLYTLAWDANAHMGCLCDGGYRGPDCSFKECPSGADPLNADGGAEGRDCSGRGTCDYSNGLCQCYKGYFGERCEFQTNFV